MGLLDTPRGGGRLASSLGGKLLPGGFATGGLACSLLCAGLEGRERKSQGHASRWVAFSKTAGNHGIGIRGGGRRWGGGEGAAKRTIVQEKKRNGCWVGEAEERGVGEC